MSELPEVEALLAEHEAVHALGREILRVRSGGNREELHRLLGQLHEHSHRFQEGMGQAKTMRRNTADKGWGRLITQSTARFHVCQHALKILTRLTECQED